MVETQRQSEFLYFHQKVNWTLVAVFILILIPVLVVLFKYFVDYDVAELVSGDVEEVSTHAVQDSVAFTLLTEFNHLADYEVASRIVAEANEVVFNLLQHNVDYEVFLVVLDLLLDFLALDSVDQAEVEDAFDLGGSQVNVFLYQAVLEVDLPFGQTVGPLGPLGPLGILGILAVVGAVSVLLPL